MALFDRTFVLPGFPAAIYREHVFLSRFAGTENPFAAPLNVYPVECEADSIGAKNI